MKKGHAVGLVALAFVILTLLFVAQFQEAADGGNTSSEHAAAPIPQKHPTETTHSQERSRGVLHADAEKSAPLLPSRSREETTAPDEPDSASSGVANQDLPGTPEMYAYRPNLYPAPDRDRHYYEAEFEKLKPIDVDASLEHALLKSMTKTNLSEMVHAQEIEAKCRAAFCRIRVQFETKDNYLSGKKSIKLLAGKDPYEVLMRAKIIATTSAFFPIEEESRIELYFTASVIR